ncbi:MAG TPA: XrtA system polysaccharide deacetylase [Steroidobacteraceae bacterium]|nr:XrtA system polysaccharide deacetylase [Steroidobacteraceae bacterium]
MRGVVNAFTVDVEDYFQVAALAPAIPRESWAEREYRVEANTERVLGVLAERGVRGTFFVLGWIAEKSPALVKRIAAAGHEIASHGYSHELIYTQTQSAFRTETSRSKRHLEDLIGEPVIGYRAASFSVTSASLWALDVLIDLGFKYDSSVFPIHHDRYGIPGAAREPGTITAPSGRTLVEFPMATAEYFGLHLPVSGGGYFRILPYFLTRAGLRRINSKQRWPFVFYMHPWEVDPGQPRVDAGLVSSFRHYTNLHRCESRLRRLLADFEFASMREVLEAHELFDAPGRVPTVQAAPPPDAPYVGPERRRAPWTA